MIVLTIIARIGDGLILTESVQHDEETGRTTYEYHSQAKSILRKLNSQSVPVCSIETGPYYFHYLIYENVCYLALCEKSFSKRLAFAYLEDLKNEFSTHYGKMVSTAMRPYSCIEFDTYMQKAKKSYSDNRARRNLTHLNTELQDVQRIMVQNIDDVLQRGAALSELDSKASNLSLLSEKYKKDAHFLNMSSAYTKLAAAATVVFVVFLYFWILCGSQLIMTVSSEMPMFQIRHDSTEKLPCIEVQVGITFQDGDRFNSCQVIYSQFGLAIHQNDHQARRRFVEWAQNEIAVVPDFHKRILFSDEAHFWLNGYVNKQNCRIGSEANPQVYVETPLHPEKLTVWCALWAGGILLQKR
ncbi:vesicle-trafficking protein SEC22b [Trichonephila clavipes]|nr:vesicle-trafficking protein SEC22b [Trichonephila clavipes]